MAKSMIQDYMANMHTMQETTMSTMMKTMQETMAAAMKDMVTGAGGRNRSDSREVTRGSRRTQRSERQLSEVCDASGDTPTKTSKGPSQRRRRTHLEDGGDRRMSYAEAPVEE